MDRPFRELHELYNILFQKAEAHAAAEAAKKEEEEKAAKNDSSGKSADGKKGNNQLPNISTSSPFEAEALEDALEEFAEGGLM